MQHHTPASVLAIILSSRRFRSIKPEIRVLGVDDGAFAPRSGGFAPIVGVVFRGGYWLDGLMLTRAEVDGLDAGSKIASMILGSPHHRQLRVIMLDGIAFAGFNIVDIKELSEATSLPVITVTRERPNLVNIRDALHNLPDYEERWKATLNAGELIEVHTGSRGGKAYMQVARISVEDAERILQLTSTRSAFPEALRVAHMIASGISKA